MPQPIGMNTELARATAAQRVQEVADRASLAAQQRQAQHAQEVRIGAESVVQEPAQSEHGALVDDRGEGQGQQRQRARKADTGEAHGEDGDHGAGDLHVIPDEEQHRLDLNA